MSGEKRSVDANRIGGERIDIFTRAARQNPYPVYDRLRQAGPVYYDAAKDVWILGRHADVSTALRESDLFSSRGTSFENVLLGSDAPQHTRVRKIVTHAFSRCAATVEDRVRVHTQRLIAPIMRKRGCELMEDLARPLPLLIIAEMLGVDLDRRDEFKRWSDAVVATGTTSADREKDGGVEKRLEELHCFFAEHIERLRKDPGSDLLSDCLTGTDDESRLSVDEAITLGKLLLVAGNETSTNLIGNAVLALFKYPEAMDHVRARPEAIPAVVEEVLRYDSPVQLTRRISRTDVVLSGSHIPANARIIAVIGSANRDPAKFSFPDRFIADRNPRDHIAFGLGPHKCLGARIARCEARFALQALVGSPLRPVADQSLNEVEFLDSFQVRGPKSLRVAFEHA
jgi:cytochrome P450